MRLVLIGDGQSPHLVKWARALSRHPHVGAGLHAVSSRGFDAAFDDLVPAPRRLALNTRPAHGGGNARVLLQAPRLARWLRGVRPDWLHAHYLTSHGTLAWGVQRWGGVPGRLAASAWGSDVLVTPQRSAPARWLTRRVLGASALATSDSQHMAGCMRALGARNVMVFPFGLESLPPDAAVSQKEPGLCFANRALEAVYDPLRVIDTFAMLATAMPSTRLVVAHDGSMRAAVERHVRQRGLHETVHFVGRLDAATQAGWYARASWYLSLPRSDSVSVSVLEAMAHGCIPVLSDVAANVELVRDGDNGMVLGSTPPTDMAARLAALQSRAVTIGRGNRAWVQAHAMFAPAVEAFVARLIDLDAAAAARTTGQATA